MYSIAGTFRVMTLTAESAGTAPGRGRLSGRRIVVVGAGSRPRPTRRSQSVTAGPSRCCRRVRVRRWCASTSMRQPRRQPLICARRKVARASRWSQTCAMPPRANAWFTRPTRSSVGLDGVVANRRIRYRARTCRRIPELWDDLFRPQRPITFPRRAGGNATAGRTAAPSYSSDRSPA